MKFIAKVPGPLASPSVSSIGPLAPNRIPRFSGLSLVVCFEPLFVSSELKSLSEIRPSLFTSSDSNALKNSERVISPSSLRSVSAIENLLVGFFESDFFGVASSSRPRGGFPG